MIALHWHAQSLTGGKMGGIRGFVISACALILTGCSTSPPPNEPYKVSVSEAVGNIEEYKTKAEAYARTLKERKADWGQEKVDKGKDLYVDAKAAFDGYLASTIANVRAEIDPRSDVADATTYKAKLDKAAEKTATFVQYVQDLRGARAIQLLVGDILVGLTQSGIAIWEHVEKTDAAKKKVLKDEITDLIKASKWPNFEDIVVKIAEPANN